MSGPSDNPVRRGVRGGLIALAMIAGGVGGWQFFAPHLFYDAFPGLGHAWVSLFPPFNAHLMQDVGGFNLAFAVLFA